MDLQNGQKRIVLVTGASSGIGAAITKQLAKANYYIFATARRKAHIEALRSSNIEPLILDVTQSDAVQEAIDTIIHNQGRIDVLINNAGYGYFATIEDGDMGAVKSQFETNFFGMMRLTKAVLPYMRQQKAGHIINLSSVVGQVAFPALGYYAATKHAIEAFSDALRMEVKPFGIKTTVVEPGAVKTEFDANALQTLKETHGAKVYDNLIQGVHQFMQAHYVKAIRPEAVALIVNKALTVRNPKCRYVVDFNAKLLIFLKKIIGDGLLDSLLIKLINPSK